MGKNNLLVRDKQHKELIALSKTLHQFKQIEAFLKYKEELRGAYVNISDNMDAKSPSCVTQYFNNELDEMRVELLDLSAILNTLKVDPSIPGDAKIRRSIEAFRLEWAEKHKQFTTRLLALRQKINTILSDIQMHVDKHPEAYNKKIKIETKGVDQNQIITKITFLINRPSFFKNNINFFSGQKKGEKDIRHWKSNDLMKAEIKRMFEGQPFDLVAEFLIDNKCAISIKNIADLQDAVFNYWEIKFNERNNLRLGDAKSNQALGRLIPKLKKKIECGKTNFEPFKLSLKSFGMVERFTINDWQTLIDFYFNANIDFNFDGRKTIQQQLDTAEYEYISSLKL